MALNITTNITNTLNGYSLDAKQVKGTHVVVSTIAERDSLPSTTIIKGSSCYVSSEEKYYMWTGTSWEIIEADIFIRGYYHNGEFYTDSTYQTIITQNPQKIYIDLNSKGFYYYEFGSGYRTSSPAANETTAGITKMYTKSGDHTDGTMNQKAITDGVNQIKFTTESIGSSQDDFMLVLNAPWSNESV